ncbi:MAG: MHYT domain-containing protein [Rhodothermales bacterium]
MHNFWHFVDVNTSVYSEITGAYDVPLIILSVLVSALANFAAITVLDRVLARSTRAAKNLWLIFGAVVMGSGVWAMHFTGMLAFVLPIPMNFNASITAISIAPAIIGAWGTLRIQSRGNLTIGQTQAAALSLALGVGIMHYTGMEAMRIDGVVKYDPFLFILSIVVAHLLATTALHVREMSVRQDWHSVRSRMVVAGWKGIAVAGMHYTAMGAARFYTTDNNVYSDVALHGDHVVLSRFILGGITFFVGITIAGSMVDRRLLEALGLAAQSETREKALLTAMTDGLIVINELGVIEAVNRSGFEMFGQPHDAVVGMGIEFLLPDVDRACFSGNPQASEPLRFGQLIEVDAIRQDESRFPVEAVFSELQLETGTFFAAVIRDVTKRHELESQLRQAHKLQSIGELAAGIAHEINTPTQYITDNTSFLKKVLPGIIDALQSCNDVLGDINATPTDAQLRRAREALGKARIELIAAEMPKAIDQSLDGLKRVSSIVSAMKSFSHPSKGQKLPVSLNEAVETTTTVARNEWKYVADVELDLDPTVPMVPCIRDEINQVILNLIVNSAHAISDMLPSRNHEKGTIRISTGHEDGFAFIRVTDNGTGISPDVQKRMFDPFFTTKKVGSGTGQGLNIAYSVIVKKHGGKILVDSKPGAGTSMTVRLPLNPAMTDESEAPTLAIAS